MSIETLTTTTDVLANDFGTLVPYRIATIDVDTTSVIVPRTNDSWSLTKTSLVVTVPPGNGTTAVNNLTGQITYTPTANWSGIDTYTYRAGDGTTNVASLVIVPVTPKAVADSTTTTVGSATTVAGLTIVTAPSSPR